MSTWIDSNRTTWDERAEPHAASEGYARAALLADPARLSGVVAFDRPRLGDVAGARTVHLQCHIGTDTLSLHRLGAEVTGLDFSAASLAQARRLAAEAGAHIDYVHATVQDALDVLPAGAFDLVYTGIGALCWLPDAGEWAAVAAALLAPGGRLFVREGHPVLWAIDEFDGDGLHLRYPYFETVEPVVLDETGTYVATDHEFVNTVTATWNHGLGEIVTALLAEGLTLTGLEEHASVPWEGLPGQMERRADGEWQLREGRERVPLSYTLQAVKPTR